MFTLCEGLGWKENPKVFDAGKETRGLWMEEME